MQKCVSSWKNGIETIDLTIDFSLMTLFIYIIIIYLSIYTLYLLLF